MQQVALNLVAIGIFAVTLTTLTGPFLHISPLVPAGLTFGALTLLTTDRFAWEGQGALLLVDAFASDEQRDRVLHHEAGHFLAAYFLGIPIAGYALTAWEAFRQQQPAGAGGVRFDTSALDYAEVASGKVALAVDRFSTVWMAGIAAEERTYGSATGGGDDRGQLKTMLRSLGFSLQARNQKERWAKLQAQALLERHADAYIALVEAMGARTSVEECYQVIQERCKTA
ncbi:hypothetical protein KR51_00001490 [Rubidibacter lacunae KORDI 51-2]|uniref:ATP-dependent Zn protease n=1 Tax=Rubidibacter lacunae KORDI 51-2 TaxID=582515 RepID=U5DQJ8_9CHRO|nr:hypothetical protein [Rubidibacter lacunae]ERN43087.1 hypothetical protein KR51_00001490 [Rubidibacter lacunae KORDI 51-2]